MLRKLKTKENKLIPVTWHSKPVFVSGLTKKQIQSELGFQIFTAEFLKRRNEIAMTFGWQHCANEFRGKGVIGLQAGIRAKRSGQAPGWPDWVNPGRKIAIELKLPGEAPSESQEAWLKYFESIGYHSEVVFYFERFREIVLDATIGNR